MGSDMMRFWLPACMANRSLMGSKSLTRSISLVRLHSEKAKKMEALLGFVRFTQTEMVDLCRTERYHLVDSF
jgi:hypothetical protein